MQKRLIEFVCLEQCSSYTFIITTRACSAARSIGLYMETLIFFRSNNNKSDETNNCTRLDARARRRAFVVRPRLRPGGGNCSSDGTRAIIITARLAVASLSLIAPEARGPFQEVYASTCVA